MRLFSFIAASALAMLLSGCGLVYKMEEAAIKLNKRMVWRA